MAARGSQDSHVDNGLLDRPLDHGLVQMMTPLHLRPGIAAPVLGGKDPLPAPLPVGARIFSGKRFGQKHGSKSSGQISLVHALCPRETGREFHAHDHRKRHDAVALALGVADHDAVRAEFDVFDSEPQTFEEPHSAAVEEHRDDARCTSHPADHGAHFGARQHDRQPARPFRPQNALGGRQRLVEHVPI